MKIILTLTTIPERLHNSIYNYDMRFCIESLLNQNYTKEYEVHINIPNVYSKTGEQYTIPEWLQEIEDSRLKIFRTDDYGSITKLIPTLERLTNKEDVIIVVDDDMVYHQELINEHLNNQNKWPDYAVGYDGIRPKAVDGTPANYFNDNRDHYFSATGINALVDILQHYKSVSYKRYFFEDDFLEFIDNCGTWCDDTSVSAYLAYKKRGRLATYYSEDLVYDDYDTYLSNLKHTFPITKYVEHGSEEGCNLDRLKTDTTINEKLTNLYKLYIDNSYLGKDWKI
jgi:hypothetical protein|tara:strand:- start:1097 stop:1945 length:849 start_codon:yes stop_codon:yes gene_type:complete